jgi:hypothetical protein
MGWRIVMGGSFTLLITNLYPADGDPVIYPNQLPSGETVNLTASSPSWDKGLNIRLLKSNQFS